MPKKSAITLSVDAMSGDRGLSAVMPAVAEFLVRNSAVKVLLVGDAATMRREFRGDAARVEFVNATQVVDMQDSPAYALKNKKDSSLRVAINLVKDGRADAVVSAGNTGALMATARFVLKTISGISRPAICASLPRYDGRSYVLDLGANVDSPAENLLQFGLMGEKLICCREGVLRPTVGLLNIGSEAGKGSATIIAADELFRGSDLNYVGFVEADAIHSGDTDLIVCDGLVGNVALKAVEGVAQMITATLKTEFKRNVFRRGSALIATPALAAIKNQLDHRRYNGASLLGLRAPVIKSHGGADAFGFGCAMQVGLQEVRQDLVRQISNEMGFA